MASLAALNRLAGPNGVIDSLLLLSILLQTTVRASTLLVCTTGVSLSPLLRGGRQRSSYVFKTAAALVDAPQWHRTSAHFERPQDSTAIASILMLDKTGTH